MSTTKRRVEVFSAGCAVCKETIELVLKLACSSCEVEIHDMHKPEVASRAKEYGIQRVPAVVINGKLASCCTGQNTVDAETLRREGVGSSA
jgi:glutaredoxin 3